MGFDYPNFGKSISNEKRAGHIGDLNEIIELGESFLSYSASKYSRIPIFCFGLSMGGLISFHMGLRKNNLLRGCVLVNPALEDNPFNKPTLKKLAMLTGMIFPPIKLMKPRRGHGARDSLENYKK